MTCTRRWASPQGRQQRRDQEGVPQACSAPAPRRQSGQGGRGEAVREIQEAYAVLSEEDKRRQYDPFGTINEAEIAARQPRRRGGAAFAGVEFRGFGGFEDLGDIFGDLFGGGGRRRPAAAPPRGGGGDRASPTPCGGPRWWCRCGASGVHAVPRQGGDRNRSCPRCHGAGVLVNTERLRVRLPEGIGDGDRVRAAHDGASGEVSVVVRVRPHGTSSVRATTSPRWCR